MSGALAVPAVLAVVYCLWTAFIAGDNGWSTGLTWLIALVSAAVLFVLCYAVGRWQHGRQPETVAASYAVLLGVALGYLLSLNSHRSVLSSTGVALLSAIAFGAAVYYITHTNMQNRRARRLESTHAEVQNRPGGRNQPARRREHHVS